MIKIGDEVLISTGIRKEKGKVIFVNDRYVNILLPREKRDDQNLGTARFSFSEFGLKIEKLNTEEY